MSNNKYHKKAISLIVALCIGFLSFPLVSGDCYFSYAASSYSADSLVKEATNNSYKGKGYFAVRKAMKANGHTPYSVGNYTDEKGYDWCAWYIVACAKNVGMSKIIPASGANMTTAYLAQSIVNSGGGKITFVNSAYYKNTTLSYDRKSYNSGYKPRKGDIVMFGTSYSCTHVAIVTEDASSWKNAKTIEGNTSGTVDVYRDDYWRYSKVDSHTTSGRTVVAFVTPNFSKCSHNFKKGNNYYGKCQNGCGTYYASVDEFTTAPANKIYTYKSATDIRVYPNNSGVVAKNNNKITGKAKVVGEKGNWYKVKVSKTSDVTYGYVAKSAVSATAAPSTLSVTTSGFTIKQGKAHTISGTVKSNYAITKIKGELGSQSKVITKSDFGKNKTTVNIAGSAIDSSLKCGKLQPGTYTLKITAWDASGGEPKTATATVKVNGDVKAPAFNTPQDVAGGKKVTIKQNESGATLYYKVGNQAWKTATGTTFTIPTAITAEGTTRVSAYSKKNNKNSATVTQDIKITKLSVPEVQESQDGKTMKVTIRAQSGTSIMYRNGKSGNFSDYKGQVLTLNDGAVITYYAKRNGYINSPVGEYTAELAEPGKPEAKLAGTESAIAVGKTATITWKQDKRATSYIATLYDASDDSVVEEKEVTEPTVSFTLNKAGDYYVIVLAKNEIGNSEDSNKVSVSAKDPVKVIFRDEGTDEEPGAILGEFSVEYGAKISAIDAPSRKGHTFAGWENTKDGTVSQNAYLKSAVKEDLTYVATYEKNSYKVKLYDQNGKILKTKTVQYGDALDAKDEENAIKGSLEVGYAFAGWQVTETTEKDSAADINSIDSDMEVHAVVSWAEPELPVTVGIENTRQVTEGNSEYIESTVKLYNDRSEDISMYLIYVLKAKDSNTGAEKTVYSDRRVVELPAGNGNEDPEKTVNLRMKPDDLVNVSDLEVVAVKRNADMTTGSTYSEIATDEVKITSDWDSWSDWSDTEYTSSDNKQVENITVYRYRDKSYTYNGADTLNGYTKESTEYYNFSTNKWQSGSYTWMGGYRVSVPEKGTTVSNSYKEVKSCTTTTAQWSYAYVTDKKNWYWTNTGGSKDGQSTKNLLQVYSSKSLAGSGYKKDTDGSYALPKTISTTSPGKMGTIYRIDYAGTGNVDTFTSGTANTWLWPRSEKTRALYRATTVRTRNKFWKWGIWSEWSDTKADKTSTRDVETKPQYRYRDRLETGKTNIEVTGTSYAFDGTIDVDTDLTGKKATIMVFQSRNTDPNKYQMQYVGQTEIKTKEDGTKNYYEFSVIPKEDPADEKYAENGNYIVALSIQGSTGLIKVGVIRARQAEYNVELFYEDENGEDQIIADGIKVKEHENIDLDSVEIPQRDGYAFLGWRNRTTDITEDCLTETESGKVCRIEAIYAPLMNAVVFVDWINQTIEIENMRTGDQIEIPEWIPSAEGYEFSHWKLEDGAVLGDDPEHDKVTGNMIISAEYIPLKYTVRFIGANNEIVDTQAVNYGDAAEPPEYTAPEGKGTFVSWSTENNWWNVQEDVDVRAVVIYDEQALAPTADVITDEETEERSLALETEEEGAEIYYTTDGTAPTDDRIKDYLNSDTDSYKGSIQRYTGPITFGETEEDEDEVTALDIIAVTYVEGKTTSEECCVYFEKNPEGEYADELAPEATDEWQIIGEYDVKAAAGKSVLLSVDLGENPGLTGYDFLIESEDGTFYTDCDEYGDPVVTGGALSENGTLTATDVAGGWRINWGSQETSTGTGNLFEITMHVDDELESGMYPIRVSYAPSRTFDEEFDEIELNNVKVTIDSEASIRMDTLEVKLARTSYEYEGKAIEPAVNIEGLKEGEDYTVEYSDNVNVGTAKAVITGMGDYAGTVEREFVITQANIANADVTAIPDQKATGSAIEPELSVSYNGNVLVKDTDYEAVYSNNVDPGTAAVTLKGKGNFKGSKTVEFEITDSLERLLEQALADKARAEQALTDAEAERDAAQSQANDLQNELDTANAEIERLQEAIDGDAGETINELTAQLEAANKAKKDLEGQLAEANRAKDEAEGKLDEAAKAKEDAEKRADDAVKALEDYKQQHPEDGGSGGNSGGGSQTQPTTPTAAPQPAEMIDLPEVKIAKPKAAKKSTVVKWKKVSRANQKKIAKIQIQYSMDKNFETGVKTTTAKKTATSKKIKRLASKKTYYVRIRAYKKDGNVIHVSKWSGVKKVKAK